MILRRRQIERLFAVSRRDEGELAGVDALDVGFEAPALEVHAHRPDAQLHVDAIGRDGIDPIGEQAGGKRDCAVVRHLRAQPAAHADFVLSRMLLKTGSVLRVETARPTMESPLARFSCRTDKRTAIPSRVQNVNKRMTGEV